MNNMHVAMIAIDELTPYDKNPRKNDDAVEAVALSIRQHGFNQPIVTDQDLRICVGHTRFEAAKLLELKEVPVFMKKMTEAEFIHYNIADNKTSEISEWDDDLLKECLTELSELDVELSTEIPGFDLDEVAKLFDDSEDTEETSAKPTSKRSSSETTKLVYNCTGKQAIEIDSKLDGIIREQGLDNQVEALIFALKSFKGNPRTKRVKK